MYVVRSARYQISSTVNGQTTNNLIDPFGLGNVAAQFDGSSETPVAHYTYGKGWSSQVSASGTSYYYDYNLQGSTVGITNAAGAYVNQYRYDPFGQVTTMSAGTANAFTFVGQDGVSSDGNDLTHMRARYYDPSTGRFVSNEPPSGRWWAKITTRYWQQRGDHSGGYTIHPEPLSDRGPEKPDQLGRYTRTARGWIRACRFCSFQDAYVGAWPWGRGRSPWSWGFWWIFVAGLWVGATT